MTTYRALAGLSKPRMDNRFEPVLVVPAQRRNVVQLLEMK